MNRSMAACARYATGLAAALCLATQPSLGAGYALSSAASDVAVNESVAGLVPEGLREQGALRVSVYGNTPYTMTDENSQLFGAVVDLAAAIAARMGLEAIIEDNASVAASRVAVESGRYELGMGPFLVSAATEEQFDLIPWVRVTPGFVFRAGEDYADALDFCGARMAIVSGSVPVENNMTALTKACEQAGNPAPVVNAYGDQNATIVAVLSGRDDASVMGSASALYVASQQRDRLGAFSAETDVFGVGLFSGLGIAKGNAELAEAVLAALRSLADDGVYLGIFAEYGLEALAVEDWVINPITGGR